MGKVEKVVVLSVLFLMVVIFAVSIPDGSGKDVKTNRVYAAEASGPRLRGDDPGTLGQAPANRAGELGIKAPKQAIERIVPDKPTTEGLLVADLKVPGPSPEPKVEPKVEPTPQAPPIKPQRKLDPRWSLVTLQGLLDTRHPDYKAYDCQNGDTYEALAQRFFGDKAHAGFLQRNNEGVFDLGQGVQLLIPCIDDTPKGQTYQVAQGDSLWTIARSQYGDGSRWKEIFEANHATLRSPDDLRLGQVLVIP